MRVGRRQASKRVPEGVLFFVLIIKRRDHFPFRTLIRSNSEDGEEQEGQGREGENTGMGSAY